MLLALTWNWHFVIYSFEILNQQNLTMRSGVIYEESLQKSLYCKLEIALMLKAFLLCL